jgi:hypothetical protein
MEGFMPKIKINTRILNRYAGQIIDEKDPQYKAFEAWAENKDRKGGMVICEFCEAKKTKKAPKKEPAEAKKEAKG